MNLCGMCGKFIPSPLCVLTKIRIQREEHIAFSSKQKCQKDPWRLPDIYGLLQLNIFREFSTKLPFRPWISHTGIIKHPESSLSQWEPMAKVESNAPTSIGSHKTTLLISNDPANYRINPRSVETSTLDHIEVVLWPEFANGD